MEDSTSQGDTVTDDEVTETEATQADQEPADDNADQPEPDTFPRSYVEQLRQENGKYRQRAQRTDELAQRLHRALVAQTGRLQDPTDLPFDETHLDDEAALSAAIDDLLQAKPHLSRRQVTGEIGQGATQSATSVDLAALLRGQR